MELISDQAVFFAEFFIVIYMLSVGMETKYGQIVAVLRQSKLIGYALLANFFLIPVFGLLLLNIFPLAADIKTGLLLLCICPGGLFALNFARVAKGNINLAVVLLFLFSLLAIITTPVATYFLHIGKEGALWPAVWMMLHLLMLMLVPLLVGRLSRNFIKPSMQGKLAQFFGISSIIVFITFTLLTAKSKSFALQSIGIGGLVIIIFLILAGWLVGWLLGGPKIENKKVMAISSSMRNVAFCLPLVLNEFANTNVIVPIIAFSALSIPMNMVFACVLKLFLRNESSSGNVKV